MKDLIKYIQQIGINVYSICGDETYKGVPQDIIPTHIYWEHNMLYFCLIFPHKDNDYQYILRINPKQSFDKWSNADLEEYYTQDAEIDIYRDLSCDDWIYRVLLEMYVERYIDAVCDKEFLARPNLA